MTYYLKTETYPDVTLTPGTKNNTNLDPRGSRLIGGDAGRRPIVCASFPNAFADDPWLQNQHPVLLAQAVELRQIGCRWIPTPEFPGLRWLFSNRKQIDVVHFHWPELYYRPLKDAPKLIRLFLRLFHLAWLYAFVFLAKLLRIPIVWTLNDVYPHGQNPTRPFEKRVRCFLMRHVSALLLCGASAEPVVRAEFGPTRRIVVAPLGNYRAFYPDKLTTEEARRKLGVGPGERVLLCFGSMRGTRNGIDLIRTFRTLPDPNLRLFVVGSSPDSLREIMEKDAQGDDRIHCNFQSVSNETLEIYLKACDWVIIPGKNYLTSGVLALGLSYGRPVISAGYGCAPSMTGDAGFLYDQDDPDGLKNAIRAALLADQPEYRRRAEAQGATFSWAKTASQTMLAYREALIDCGRLPHSEPPVPTTLVDHPSVACLR